MASYRLIERQGKGRLIKSSQSMAHVMRLTHAYGLNDKSKEAISPKPEGKPGIEC
nr:MAG TPA: hypothetical protein [Caudoviricetes sp.]DAT22559.1 MAG TPA: hypothetical protein [Caudoviricetes sp.]